MGEPVRYSTEGSVAFITLARPEALNAVDDETDRLLIAALERFDLDESVHVAVLHGEGRAFCAGVDVKQRLTVTDEARSRAWVIGPGTTGYLARCLHYKPVVACVHGYCLGLGLVLALEADLLVAADDARFGIAETRRGLAGGRVWARLQSQVPAKLANELLLTGDEFGAETLARCGLVNRLVRAGDELEAATELARHIAQLPAAAVRAGVRLIRWSPQRAVAEADLYVQSLGLHTSRHVRDAVETFADG